MFSSTDAYVKAALSGLAICGAAAITILAAVLIFAPSDFGFPLFVLVFLTIEFLVLRFIRRWGLLLGALLAAFGLLILSQGADLILSTPQAFLDFLLTVFGLSGLLIVLIACLVGFVQYFRGPVSKDMAPGVKKTIRGVAVVVSVLAVVSLVATVMNVTKSVSAEEKQGAPELVAKHTKWNEQQITASGKPVKVFLKNDDPILHTFTLRDSAKGIDVDVHLGPWSEQVVDLGTLAPGTYGFICRIEGHQEDMTGALTVR